MSTVLASALAGHPIVIVTGSGGAADAIHQYCFGGLDAVEERFRAQEPELNQIRCLNELYNQKQLHFFSLRPDSRPGFGTDIGKLLLEGIVGMVIQQPAWTFLPVGSVVTHPEHGRGTISQKHPNGLTVTRPDRSNNAYYNWEALKLRFDLEVSGSV